MRDCDRNSRFVRAVWVSTPAIFYLAACIYTGKEYFGSTTSSSSYEGPSSTYHDDHHDDHQDDHHRVLAGTSSSFYTSTSETDTAAWLCLAGPLSGQLVVFLLAILWMPYRKRNGLDVQSYVLCLEIAAPFAPVHGSPFRRFLLWQRYHTHEYWLCDSSLRRMVSVFRPNFACL